jgi:hypothetical protein
MNYAQFLARYPEFTTTDSPLLVSTLAEAALSIDVTIYGAKADAAQGLLCAHLLWSGVAGNSLRLTSGADPQSKPNSPYWPRYMRLLRESAVGFTVL